MAEVKSFRQSKIPFHPLGVDLEVLHHIPEFHEHVIHQDARVRQNDSLRAGMTNVALVPKGYVLERGQGIPAHHPGQTTEPLTRDGISFVRHGRATFLAFAKKFFDFENFSAL